MLPAFCLVCAGAAAARGCAAAARRACHIRGRPAHRQRRRAGRGAGIETRRARRSVRHNALTLPASTYPHYNEGGRLSAAERKWP